MISFFTYTVKYFKQKNRENPDFYTLKQVQRNIAPRTARKNKARRKQDKANADLPQGAYLRVRDQGKT